MSAVAEKSSFRDRDGFIFYKGKNTYRAISRSYQFTFDQLIVSSLYSELCAEKKLIAFESEADLSLLGKSEGVYKIFKVPTLPFISYPGEWTFGQLKKAALLTLYIQKKALHQNFSLKDATAYNVQFTGSKAVFIDSLSFEPYHEGEPWVAYQQFCQHFLGPLLLAHYGLAELQTLFLNHMDGPPLRLVSKLLPFRSNFSLLAYTHIHLHAKFEKKHGADTHLNKKQLHISKKRSLALLEHMEQGIKTLEPKNSGTNWTDYYNEFSYSEKGFTHKKEFVEKHFKQGDTNICVDLGANTGEFSELACKYFKQVVACDSDLEVVKKIQQKKIPNLLALHINLFNPTPNYGWNNEERTSFIARAKQNDLVLSLALIHHLCIGNNIPLNKLAEFFAGFCKTLILEFVPKNDPQVKKLMVSRKDVFDDYDLENFKIEFLKYFEKIDELSVPDSERILFCFKNKSPND